MRVCVAVRAREGGGRIVPVAEICPKCSGSGDVEEGREAGGRRARRPGPLARVQVPSAMATGMEDREVLVRLPDTDVHAFRSLRGAAWMPVCVSPCVRECECAWRGNILGQGRRC